MARILNTLEITKRLGVSEATFIDMVQRQGLPAKKNADAVFEISEKDLDAWQSPEALESKAKTVADKQSVKSTKTKRG